MLKKRLISCLLWREGQIVQTVNFRHNNLIGNALTAVDFFNAWAIDEIVILDVSPDESKRNLYFETIKEISKRCFVPLAAGGKIKKIEEIREFLKIGADKVVINTQAVKDPSFLTEASCVFGSQCIVVSIDAKGKDAYVSNGKEKAGITALEWAKKAERLGAGEIFLTSIDRDGTNKGYDLNLVKEVSSALAIPVIASGGVGDWEHLVEGIKAGAEAVSAANIFHYSEQSTKKAKNYMKSSGIDVREPEFYQIPLQRKPKYQI